MAVVSLKGHLLPRYGGHQHLESNHTQAPHVVGSVIQHGGGQAGDDSNQLRGTVLWCAEPIPAVLCSITKLKSVVVDMRDTSFYA